MARMIAGRSLIGFLVLGALVLGCQKGAKEQKKAADEGPFTGDPTTVVAKVGDQKVLLEEVDHVCTIWKNNGRAAQMGLTTERDIQRKVLDSIIDQKLLFTASQKAGLTPTPDQINQVLQGLQGRFPNPDAFQAALKQQGVTEDQLKSDILSDLAIRNYIEKTAPDTGKVTAQDARDFYDKNPDQFQIGEMLHARHILIKVDEKATPEQKEAAKARAQRLLEKIRAGADFATVAKDSSQDEGSAPQGGDLGRFGHGQMVPSFDAAAFQLQPGQVSDVVETQFGYHIIKLEERIAPQKIPYDPKLEARIEQQLSMDRRNDIIKKHVEVLRSGVKIEKDL